MEVSSVQGKSYYLSQGLQCSCDLCRAQPLGFQSQGDEGRELPPRGLGAAWLVDASCPALRDNQGGPDPAGLELLSGARQTSPLAGPEAGQDFKAAGCSAVASPSPAGSCWGPGARPGQGRLPQQGEAAGSGRPGPLQGAAAGAGCSLLLRPGWKRAGWDTVSALDMYSQRHIQLPQWGNNMPISKNWLLIGPE